MKKEVLQLLKAMDEILLGNKFNLQIMATIPGIVFFYSSSIVFAKVIAYLTSNSADIRESQNENLQFRVKLRDIHAALTAPGLCDVDGTFYGGMSSIRVGMLDSSVVRCLRLLRHRSMDERIRFRDDLCQLMDSALSIKQRVEVFTRIRMLV
jgi:hypothetical protein